MNQDLQYLVGGPGKPDLDIPNLNKMTWKNFSHVFICRSVKER